MHFPIRRPALARAAIATGLVIAVIAGAGLARAEDSTPPAWVITLSGPSSPSFALGQVDIKLHVADQNSAPLGAGNQVSLTGEGILVTANTDANGNVEFPSSDFTTDNGMGDTYLGVGQHTLSANFDGADSLPITFNVTQGQVQPQLNVTNIDETNGDATFGFTLSDTGSLPNDVFPTSSVYLIENGDTTHPISKQVTPIFNGTSVSASFGTWSFDSGSTYQAYFIGDNNFAATTSAPWSDTASINTSITWSSLPAGQTEWPAGSTTVTATIGADTFNGQVNGNAELLDNGTQVATTTITDGTNIVFNFAPAAGEHLFTIHYDGAGVFLPSTSNVDDRTYATSETTSGGNPPPQQQGYRLVAADGTVTNFNAPNLGDMHGRHLTAPIIAAVDTTDKQGYWLIAADGGIFSFGDAKFYGSMGGQHLNAPVVGMAPTKDDGGYWLVAADGGVFSYGDAVFYGSMGGQHLNAPVVGMTTSTTGNGYRFVASDGGIFSYGDATFYGSAGSLKLNRPVVGMAPTGTGGGYWLVASDGGIFSYGDAGFFGSAGGLNLNKPIVGMLATATSGGYWFVASDGGVFNYGDAGFYGAQGAATLSSPIVAIG